MMLSVENFAVLGVFFTVIIIVLMLMALLVALKDVVKEKTDWFRRKWLVEHRLDDLERRVNALEDAYGPSVEVKP